MLNPIINYDVYTQGSVDNQMIYDFVLLSQFGSWKHEYTNIVSDYVKYFSNPSFVVKSYE